mmetsp:Transcript_49256/g.115228  ORF Transcript_49256/g.115228 Transcript_49256/m.115228 type:complete len:216 (+) Transcript_49256:196-843(+)
MPGCWPCPPEKLAAVRPSLLALTSFNQPSLPAEPLVRLKRAQGSRGLLRHRRRGRSRNLLALLLALRAPVGIHVVVQNLLSGRLLLAAAALLALLRLLLRHAALLLGHSLAPSILAPVGIHLVVEHLRRLGRAVLPPAATATAAVTLPAAASTATAATPTTPATAATLVGLLAIATTSPVNCAAAATAATAAPASTVELTLRVHTERRLSCPACA